MTLSKGSGLVRIEWATDEHGFFPIRMLTSLVPNSDPCRSFLSVANSLFALAVHTFMSFVVLRGFGGPVAKSLVLFRVSVQPLAFLDTELVLLGAGVGPLPRKQLAVLP